MDITFETLLHFKPFGGVENEKSGVEFASAKQAQSALAALGATIDIPAAYLDRPATVRQHLDRRVIVDLEKREQEPLAGWRRINKRSKLWTRIFDARMVKDETLPDFDNEIRCVKCAGQHFGWLTKSPQGWLKQPSSRVWSA